MRDAVSIPVTIKHRLGIDSIEDYEFVRRFVEILADAGCRTFIVHARNAILKGLSPKDNRQVPVLKYEYVYRLKQEFPECCVVINGGITSAAEVGDHLQRVDGVMLGRSAYHNPYLLTQIEADLDGAGQTPPRAEIVMAMWAYAGAQVRRGTQLRAITRHMLGLYHGQPHARAWRRLLSDPARLAENRADLILEAQRIVSDEVLAVNA
jgi:tRNA-dihydrouridine synthase A